MEKKEKGVNTHSFNQLFSFILVKSLSPLIS